MPSIRRHINCPALLIPAIEERVQELHSGTFSRFVVELVCYDFRIRRAHGITGHLAQESAGVQDAVDRAIVAHYRPGQKTSGDTIRALVRNTLSFSALPTSGGSMVKESRWVFFPSLLREIIEIRWRELHFASLSDYTTSLIRYDLLLGGPHKLFRGDDCTPEMLAALDRETLLMFHENATNQPRILADYIVEEAAGQKLSLAQSDAALANLGRQMVREASKQ
jgi:hypothetical protein